MVLLPFSEKATIETKDPLKQLAKPSTLISSRGFRCRDQRIRHKRRRFGLDLGYASQIVNIRWVLEQLWGYQQHTTICFKEFAAKSDSGDLGRLFIMVRFCNRFIPNYATKADHCTANGIEDPPYLSSEQKATAAERPPSPPKRDRASKPTECKVRNRNIWDLMFYIFYICMWFNDIDLLSENIVEDSYRWYNYKAIHNQCDRFGQLKQIKLTDLGI